MPFSLARLFCVRRHHGTAETLLDEARFHVQRLPHEGVRAQALRSRGLPDLPHLEDGDRAPPDAGDLIQGSHGHQCGISSQGISRNWVSEFSVPFM